MLFFGALLLTAYTARRPAAARGGAAMFSEALAPLQVMHNAVHSRIANLWSGYIALVHTQAENQRLRRRLGSVEAENSALRELRSENERLRRLLNVADQTGHKGLLAQVIAYSPSNWTKRGTINRGTLHGLLPGRAVLDGSGVVGQVIAAGPRTAQVLLLTDHSSGVDAMLQDSRAHGIVEGTGEGRCRMNYVRSEEEVHPGERVITSGLDGVFPKGLVIGTVASVRKRGKGMLFQEVTVQTAVDFDKLEDLLVVERQG